jgi:hypothetical protein
MTERERRERQREGMALAMPIRPTATTKRDERSGRELKLPSTTGRINAAINGRSSTAPLLHNRGRSFVAFC